MGASRFLVQGQRLAARDQLDEALHAFEQALARRPRMAGARLHYALALSAAGRLDEAIGEMHQAMAIEPHNAVLPMFLGLILFDHADYAGAQTWCEKSLELDPQQLRAQALLALIDLAEGRIAHGYERLQQPQKTTLTALERLALKCSLRPPPPLYQQSSSMWQSRLLLVVETHLMQAGEQAPTLAKQLLHESPQAQALDHVGAVDRALTRGVIAIMRLYYRLRYASQPAQRELWLRYAQAEQAYFLAQSNEAADAYERLLPHFPDPSRLEQRLYDIAYAQGDFKRAWRHWRRWVKTASPKLSALDQLQQAELQYQIGDYDGVKTTLEHITSLPWLDFRVPYYQGLCHLRTGAKREAQRCFAEAARRLNDNVVGVRLDALHQLRQAQPDAPAAEQPSRAP